MKPKHQRALFLLLAVAIIAASAALVLTRFRENLVFFVTPTQLHEKLQNNALPHGQVFRLGGLVKTGSLSQNKAGEIAFIITDLTQERRVTYRGIVPALFREGQGAVVEGTLGENGTMRASTLLAKHDENYMPPEVAEALKKSGRWQHYGTTPQGKPSSKPFTAKPE